MLANRVIDLDIIDHLELAKIYPGFGTIDVNGNGYLAVSVQNPDAAIGKGAARSARPRAASKRH
ncbi:hypothetical protein [Sphingomonas sp. RIT328]|uniref:hypothetical protein n=1 Tax=Sphingomonas sp. RIT328 TaxID=1470591 RepID=UPI00044A3676|nr:hypothetical protein [Sphingomonas sp. RIT328]EZP51332.1 hypothetical protein BW41_02763 [Sphingomonas sp. RIT328]